ncbi:FAD-dependent oxidoreductase [Streptomyces albicerus]|uniref:FAD-dependent oxidoreductase n=1 Tax=Streptomyces albicerus TaxID=2569859 RepID=UPI001CED04E9|nr:FAD-dependent oxidoreductase [Streptomyces albicerus]
MPADPRPQVLIAGAGPVGLTAAHELARRGLDVRVVDAAPGPARSSRAVAVHPRTLETLDQMGVVDALRERGRENRAFTMFASGRRLVRLEADYASMPTRFPYTVIVEQSATEAVLREAVAAQGVAIEWGVKVTGFDQDTDSVRVRLQRADGGEQTCRADWLVGCDGGHSTVRKQLGLPLIGESRDTWMLADAPVRTDLVPDSIYWVHTGQQALMMVPYARQGHWRLLDTAPGDQGADAAARRLSEKLSAGLGTPVAVGEPEWTSVFTFQQRMVPRMHEGRVFVAGDAAHVHSPASGQGMNTGIQEAYNLAWKLAAVARGHAGRHLLDTYDEERVPIGRALLGSTRTATFLVQFKNLLAAAALPVVFTVVRKVAPLRRAIQRKVLGGMSGLRIGYRDCSLSLSVEEPRRTRPPLTGAGSRIRRRGADRLARPSGTGPAPGERVSAAAAVHAGQPGPDALAAELREVRWTLLWAAGAPQCDAVPAETAARAAASHTPWLSVRTVGARPGSAPGALPDPGRTLRDALGLGAGGWLLIRPDGYLAARGARLTQEAWQGALSALGLGVRKAAALQGSSCVPPADRDRVLSTITGREDSR